MAGLVGVMVNEVIGPNGGPLRGLGGEICTIKGWNLYQINVYGMLGVGTEGTMGSGAQTRLLLA